MAYGTSKTLTEHISVGEPYKNIKKIYSINIVYFDLGQGEDYIYHGKTDFIGYTKKINLNYRKNKAKMLGKTGAFWKYFPDIT